MKPNFTLLAYMFASILIVSFFAKSLDLLVDRANTTKAYPTANSSSTYRDSTGELKYTKGSCSINADCMPTGCGSEFCASEELVTTCEVKSDAPSTDYECACLDTKCAWILK